MTTMCPAIARQDTSGGGDLTSLPPASGASVGGSTAEGGEGFRPQQRKTHLKEGPSLADSGRRTAHITSVKAVFPPGSRVRSP